MQACFIRNVVHFKKVGIGRHTTTGNIVLTDKVLGQSVAKVGIGRHTNIVLTGKVLGQSMFFVNNQALAMQSQQKEYGFILEQSYWS